MSSFLAVFRHRFVIILVGYSAKKKFILGSNSLLLKASYSVPHSRLCVYVRKTSNSPLRVDCEYLSLKACPLSNHWHYVNP